MEHEHGVLARLEQARRTLGLLEDEKETLDEKLAEQRQLIAELEASAGFASSGQGAAVEKPAIPVSDHATVRFLERVMGLDMDAIRKAIVPADVAVQIRLLRDGVFPAKLVEIVRFRASAVDIPEQYRLRVRGGEVVTVLV